MPLLALPFPAIDPVLIEIGPFAIRWYALAYVTGLLFGWWYLRRLVSSPSLWGATRRPTALDIDDLLVWVTLGVVLGGRIGYVLFYNFAAYREDPWEILKVWHGGMAFHGALAGTALAILLYARRNGQNVWSLYDLAAAAVPVGLFLGRIANFINGELFGRPTDVPWAVVFPTADDYPRHPSQLYEAGLEGLVLFVVLTLLVRSGALARPGLVTGVFGIGYGLSRSFVEFFRSPDPQVGYIALDFVTMGMLLSVPLVVIGAALVVYARGGHTVMKA
ncbi:prolipoprotein diacylglyceryl transferase [Chthonobacter rhizosphaerae]|uniref:prolipoprotein diacylglyceryl transferase n=1 Tax=Chthonobacter rhizosphaerae TaxID=2735553 RepID=UPI0015EF04A9|nr:prolipoprotein diacylglyceryl transferase [Chthonobacter rhizosphaerae]